MENKNQKTKHPIGVYIIIIISIIIYFIGFIWYNEESKRIYKTSLSGITNMYYNTDLFDANSIMSNHNLINNRIIFLEERIAHYQNDANHFASLWLTLLSLLFVIITGFNLFNLNEKRKELNKLHMETNEKLEIATKLIDDLNSLKTELAVSMSNITSNKQVKNIRGNDNV